jgi:RNA polymerase sigma-70 factor (ECF subfamily)
MLGERFFSVLDAARAGDEWAFAQLYRDLNAPLLRYFAAQAPLQAEDLASETWLGAARGLGSFDGDEAAFRAWLFTIAHRRLVQHWRSVGRNPAMPVVPGTFDHILSEADTEREAMESMDPMTASRAIAAALPRDQAQVVLLRILAGLSVEQVATILGKRPGTVRVLQHRALRRLADVFSRETVTQ